MANHKGVYSPCGAIGLLAYLASYLCIANAIWLGIQFDAPSLDQVVLHLQFGLSGLVEAETSLIHSYLVWCVSSPILGTLATCLVGRQGWLDGVWTRVSQRRLVAALLVISLVALGHRVSVAQYVRASIGEDFLGRAFRDPRTLELDATRKKNLVLVYVESLESTYSVRGLFDEDLLQPLTAAGGFGFERFVQSPGAQWTMGGLVSSQCGFPLKHFLFGGNALGERVRAYLPNALCLGDILAKHEYRNVFLNGPGLSFAGMGKFLREHGYATLLGKDQWREREIDEGMFTSWGDGIHDETLLTQAEGLIDQLEEDGRPYNLTVLTVDSHGPYGHPSPECRMRQGIEPTVRLEGKRRLNAAVRCTVHSLRKLVDHINERGYLANTVVAILGDHLLIAPEDWKAELFGEEERYVFNRFFTNSEVQPPRNDFIHFDVLPTVLDLMGFTLPESGQVGLGFSGLKADGLFSKFDESYVLENILNRSEIYSELWGLDE